MSYTALYRKFRPSDLSQVKGQDHIVTTLRNQLAGSMVGHAYLFTGTRGTGKTSIAKILARAVNCENPTENGPCGECAMCRAIADGSSLNVYEIDAASNTGVDNVRMIIDEVAYRPTLGKYKVYIIDEVHMLSESAFNALLKTLEEPPEWTLFILATTEVHKVPATILSRCQRYDFKRIGIETIVERMQELLTAEGREADERALRYIARKADGSMRDALSLLDQAIAFQSQGTLSYDKTLEVLGAVDTEVFSRLYRSILNRDTLQCVKIIDDMTMQGKELTQFVTDFVWYLRNIMLMIASADAASMIDMSSDNLAKLKEDAAASELDTVIRHIRVFSDLINQIRYANQKRVYVEIAFIRCCEPRMAIKDPESLTDRVASLEKRLEEGNFNYAPSGQNRTDSQEPVIRSDVKLQDAPKAVPDDVRQLMENWPRVLNDCGSDTIILKTCKPVLGDDGKLVLYCPKDDMVSRILNNDAPHATISEIFENHLGKKVEFTIQDTDNEELFDALYDLRNMIKPGAMNVPIETEEDTEDF
ncbi:MAG: DNA polymerase III subunit gamma/tau [Lachnospiraceae bacterium]|nr:DNA polymerase III subunit gamma/tau [Lachnospiraceae bacterium]